MILDVQFCTAAKKKQQKTEQRIRANYNAFVRSALEKFVS